MFIRINDGCSQLFKSQVLTALAYALAAVFTAIEVAVAECRRRVILITVEYGDAYRRKVSAMHVGDSLTRHIERIETVALAGFAVVDDNICTFFPVEQLSVVAIVKYIVIQTVYPRTDRKIRNKNPYRKNRVGTQCSTVEYPHRVQPLIKYVLQDACDCITQQPAPDGRIFFKV